MKTPMKYIVYGTLDDGSLVYYVRAYKTYVDTTGKIEDARRLTKVTAKKIAGEIWSTGFCAWAYDLEDKVVALDKNHMVIGKNGWEPAKKGE
jgi:hypothetical protein